MIKQIALSLLLVLATACTAETASGPDAPVDTQSEVSAERFRDPQGTKLPHTAVEETEMDKLQKDGYTCTVVTPVEGYRCEKGDVVVYCTADKNTCG